MYEDPGSPGPDRLIAVVGIGGRFPPALDADGFWDLLIRRGEAIRPVPADRWDAAAQIDPEKEIQGVGGFLDGVDGFDATFFGISPREAADIDPQQRLMLEMAWRALEDGGQRAERLRGSRTGVYVGASWHDYEILRKHRGAGATQHSLVGNALDVIASRVSYVLGLSGPSLVVETGCSSSLVALDLARQALWAGEIEAALVGGVNLILTPDVSIGLTHFGGLSPEGRCKAFAASADGFVRAECVAALYLKRLDRALADGDPVRGIVMTTAVNNDGGGESLVTPSPAGQEDLLRRAYDGLGIPLDRLQYVEAHGTGTGRGDPIEAGAIGRVLGRGRTPGVPPLAIGSVKTNIGHAEAAAGMAGLIKALLAIEHGVVPPSLHAEQLNPAIDFDALNLQVTREPLELPADGPVYLGVNSFGWGGTNAHVVLAGPLPAVRPPAAGCRAAVPAVLPLSAHSAQALAQRVRDIGGLMADVADPAPVAGALARRDHFAFRVAVLAGDPRAAAARLAAFATDPDADIPAVVSGRADTVGRIAFVFPGQGGQWAAMGEQLYARHTTFARAIDRCAAALAPYLDWDLAAVVAGAAGPAWLSRVDKVQPALWAMSVALAEVWRAAGVSPDVVVGHSQGEVAAATIAGILTHDNAARIIARRSVLAMRTSGRGRMLAVSLDPAGVRAALAGFEDLVSLAVNNGPTSCVLSGEAEAVLALDELLKADGVTCRLVEVDYASHSPQMDEITGELLEALREVRPAVGDIPLMSTVRVASLEGPEMDARYWAENLRRPVMFQDAMTRLFDDGVTHVVEISPHPVLTPAMEHLAALREQPPRVLATLSRDAGSPQDLALAFARGYVSGLEPFAGLPDGAAVRLPAYPWQRSAYWAMPGRPRTVQAPGLAVPLTPSPSEQGQWQGSLELGVHDQPWLEDHRVHDAVVVPGTVLLALALRTGEARAGLPPATLSDVSFDSHLTLGGEPARLGVLWRDDITEGGSWTLQSLSPDGSAWTVHAHARVRHPQADLPTPVFPSGLLTAGQVEAGAFYATCARRGLNYGPAFLGVQRLHLGQREALAEVELPARCRAGAAGLILHPALWDAALQVSLALDDGAATVVPTGVDSVHLHAEPAGPLTRVWSHALRRGGDRYDVHVFDGARQPLLSMVGVRLRTLAPAQSSDPDAGRLHRLRFVAQPRGGAATGSGRWMVCGDGAEPGPLARALPGVTLPSVTLSGAADPARLREAGELTGVVYLAPTAACGLAAQRRALAALAGLARSCLALPTPPRLVVVTADAQPVVPEDLPDPGAALFWGFTRVLRREHGELASTVLDVAARDGDWAEQVAAELTCGDGDDQVVLRGSRRFVGRILPGSGDGHEPDASPPWRSPAQPFRLVQRRPGQWDGLEFRPLQRRRPGPGEVEIEVTAAALNFIDVMKAMGTYPDPVGAALFGGECAGRVTRLGEEVTGLAPGDRVAACGFGALASHLTLDAGRVRQIPAGLADAEAAALPLVTMTAWYGLAELARLGPGETVLIHSAAGGLGLAAIGVARHLGADVLATAGSEAKREYLRSLGIDRVFDSRDLSWARDVRAATAGRGVDVVLNSLTGAAIDLGMQALAEDGRFIEVGKKDIYAGRTLAMDAFRKGISFSEVDLAGLMDRRPARFARQFAEVWELVGAGELPRLPVLEHRFVDAAEAMRAMSHGNHIGKLVLSDPESVAAVTPEPMPGGLFRSDGTYLITGGLGALGLSLAEFLAGHGAGALALLGRTPPGAAAAARIEALRRAGVRVRSYAVDVGDAGPLADTLAQVRTQLPPLRGVVHAAGLLDDATIATLRPEQVERVISPKIDGARHLDDLTASDPVDLFVLFSSAAALVGNAGQAAYAAANAFLDALAEARRRRGLPALSVQWGPFADIGLAAQDGNRGDRLAERGMGSFPPAQAWQALTRLLDGPDPVIGYLPLNVRQWFDAYPDTVALPSWQALRDGGQQSAGGVRGQFLDRLQAAPSQARGPLVEEKVRELTGRVLRMDPVAIDRDTPFKALGLDSLMSLELRNRLEAAFDLKLSPTLLWTYGTSGALTKVLCERLLQHTDA
jgi:phthiocerol/phenolphthiocerol synthesis type-I polyketide synthase C